MAPSPSPLATRKHDVFISFRGKDTRKKFTSYLSAAMRRKGIRFFMGVGLGKGSEILAGLMEAIEQSRIAVIVFSKSYASSPWCLDELVKILECQNTGLVVLPVFFRISPSVVGKQIGRFAEAFDKHEVYHKDKVQKWRAALKTAAEIAGFDSLVTSPEAELVERIVEDVLKKLTCKAVSDDDEDSEDKVGIDSQVESIKSLLDNESNDVRIIGIWGMGGSGKTCIAQTLFKQISCQFDSCCFVDFNSESSRNDLIDMRNKLRSKILAEENLNMVRHSFIQKRLREKKVLIVLDGVNNPEQTKCLAGQSDWFGQGSRIIITTRDTRVLRNGVDATYKVKLLNDHDALCLFCLKAFNQNHPPEGYMGLSNRVVNYARGIPFALKELGLFLHGKSKPTWESALDKFEKILKREIHDNLRESYDELDDEEQKIFLDLAFFFEGKEMDYVTNMLDACELSTRTGIETLIEKSLVTLSHNRLRMHNLQQRMGREIVRQECDKEPGNRSRLSNDKDICRVLKKKKGTAATRGIHLDMSKIERTELSCDAFKEMCDLRFLKFYNSHCSRSCEDNCKLYPSDGLNSLSDELRQLHWHKCPLRSLPSEFNPEKLVELHMCYSNVEKLWNGSKRLVNLKWINLSHSQQLKEMPDLSEAPNIESIILEGCTSLVEVHSSIIHVKNLVFLNLKDCKNLSCLPSIKKLKSLETLVLSGCSKLKWLPKISRNIKDLRLDGTALEQLPRSITNCGRLVSLNLENCTQLESLPTDLHRLRSLRYFILSGCTNLESFPKMSEPMENLEILMVDGTAIKEIPTTLNMNSLKILSVSGCKGQQSSGLLLPPLQGSTSLTDLYLSGCNLLPFPGALGNFSSLQHLDLSGNDFESIPACFKQLRQLKWVDLRHCKRLRSIPELPSRVEYLDADNCISLETVSSPSNVDTLVEWNHSMLIFTNCFKLGVNTRGNIVADAQMKSQLLATLTLKHYHQRFVQQPVNGICFPGREIPEWLTSQSMGPSVTAQLPSHWCNTKFAGFALGIVVTFNAYNDSHGFLVKCECNLRTSHGDCLELNCVLRGWHGPYGRGNKSRSLRSDHVFLGYNHCMLFREYQGDDWPNKCCPTIASFKFHAVDDIESPLQCCEVIKCGFSLVYGQDENQCSPKQIEGEIFDGVMFESKRCRFEPSKDKAESSRGGNSDEDEHHRHRKRLREIKSCR